MVEIDFRKKQEKGLLVILDEMNQVFNVQGYFLNCQIKLTEVFLEILSKLQTNAIFSKIYLGIKIRIETFWYPGTIYISQSDIKAGLSFRAGSRVMIIEFWVASLRNKVVDEIWDWLLSCRIKFCLNISLQSNRYPTSNYNR